MECNGNNDKLSRNVLHVRAKDSHMYVEWKGVRDVTTEENHLHLDRSVKYVKPRTLRPWV